MYTTYIHKCAVINKLTISATTSHKSLFSFTFLLQPLAVARHYNGDSEHAMLALYLSQLRPEAQATIHGATECWL